MISKQALHRFLGPTLLTLALLGALYLVTLVYATGETLLAGTLLVTVALSIWIYTSERCYAYRYLFPGIAAALIFVVFPMVYTISIGFTNYSSKNLLDFKRATNVLLGETYRVDGPTYTFSLHPDGRQYRLRLEDAESAVVYFAGPVDVPAEVENPRPVELKADPALGSPYVPGEEATLKDVIARQKSLEKLTVVMPDGAHQVMTGLREFAPSHVLYQRNADGTLTNNQDGSVLKANFKTGFYETASGEHVDPGFHVQVGWGNFARILTDTGLREPFLRIFLWTLTFSLLSVVFTCCLGMVLAVLLSWDALRFKGLYRLMLFLPYAVPAFISILVWKGLFNNNTGEINLILSGLFGLKPAWFSSPMLARTMLLIVNTWLGFPYMMIVCTGLIKAIPADLYEASAVAGAGPLTNFFRITVPLIRRPLTPLLISSFAFNFNNFVLISLLTGGRPDFLDTSLPAGTTDVLVSYTYRMAFQDHGQEFGLAAAISALIFLLVAVLTFIQIRATKIVQEDKN
jgi:maltose/maltodextrin transport system permease protein